MLKYSKERNNLFHDGVQIDKDINDLRIFKVGTVSWSLIVLIRGKHDKMYVNMTLINNNDSFKWSMKCTYLHNKKKHFHVKLQIY
jgi:hypothetical protein